MNNKLSIASRILVAFASGALVAVFFLPAWRIDLFAPQYPEGLTMKIWINGLSGDLDIINGLNHYIGMKHITKSMFPEFSFLPYIVAFFMLLGMIVAITGKRKLLFIYLMLTAIGGALALYDFYRWGYDYGHHLDPQAPIQVPGLYYQPPLVGHKRLLNFDAYSFPDVGGWVVMAAGAMAFIIWLAEWYHHRKPFRKKITGVSLTFIAAVLILTSCSTQPSPFRPGKDNCDFCKMGVIDTRFGGELITKKGKTYKFDDLHCFVAFLNAGTEEEKNISKKLVILFGKPNEFNDATRSFFLISPQLKSPMSSNAAAFPDRPAAELFAKGKETRVMSWEELYNKLK